MTDNMFERTAMICSEWPEWLHDAVDEAIDVSDKMDWSTEQVLAYAILKAREGAAQIAEDWVGPVRLLPLADDAHNEGAGIGMYEAGERIAQAIRQHSQKGRDND